MTREPLVLLAVAGFVLVLAGNFYDDGRFIAVGLLMSALGLILAIGRKGGNK